MTSAAPSISMLYQPRLARRKACNVVFYVTGAAVCAMTVALLATLIGVVLKDGWTFLTVRFVTSFPSRIEPELAGVKPALFGSLCVVLMTGVISVPLGVGAAVYLSEYAGDSRLNRFIQLNIANLAGVPSIVYGLLGLAVFVRWLHLGSSILAGSLTMSLLVLPVIIISAREAIAAVPQSLRQAAYALGATRWQTVRAHVLPSALPGILTGVILSLSRAVGEAAPLLIVGAAAFMLSMPGSQAGGGAWNKLVAIGTDNFAVLPIQIFNWCKEPDVVFQQLAAAGIVVLLAALLAMNSVAVGIRLWHQRKRTW
ncbi:MAG: phosphate ABC transporter permease PstA [Phycisphaerales bacterium]|nr:phosphate ABC transporter permease PstA [Phycisphaerales bacterium]